MWRQPDVHISSSGVNGTCYHVVNVTVDGVFAGSIMTSYTFNNVTAPHSITATLAPDVYTITVTQTAHGTISGSSQANCGGNATFTITPDPVLSNSYVKRWMELL
jgi:hypothetical protein